jgi:hypothetical protein
MNDFYGIGWIVLVRIFLKIDADRIVAEKKGACHEHPTMPR